MTFIITFPDGETRCGLTITDVAAIRAANYEGHGTMTVRSEV